MPSTVTCSRVRANGQRSTVVARIPIVPVDPLDHGALGLDERGVGQHVEDMPGPALLHGDRADPGVERAGLERGGDGETQLLSRDVVEVRLEQERRLPGSHRRACGIRRPITTWVQFGRSSISPAPPPNPEDATVMSGSGPKAVESAASRAAPVGVVSSRETSRP